jgi:hypothetical protein
MKRCLIPMFDLNVERSSFALLSGATARQASACHAEAFGVGGFDRLDYASSFATTTNTCSSGAALTCSARAVAAKSA